MDGWMNFQKKNWSKNDDDVEDEKIRTNERMEEENKYVLGLKHVILLWCKFLIYLKKNKK